MIQGIANNTPKVWQGHPDVALFNEKIFIVYRQSDRHATVGKTSLKLITSELSSFPNFIFSEPITIADTENRFNCPRLKVIGNSIYIICDEIVASPDYIRAENESENTKVILFHSKNGIDWEQINTNITGIVPDRIFQTHDGRFLIATHTKETVKSPELPPDVRAFKEAHSGFLYQNVWVTDDLRSSWECYTIAKFAQLSLCEASIFSVGKKYIALMRENSQQGLPAFAATSVNGIEWGELRNTRLFGCHRPVCGVLKSGKILTTYREQSCSFKRGYWAKNTFACLSLSNSVLRDFNRSIILPIDHDNSIRSDSGYTGWIQLPNKQIFIVNYITKEQSMPYISWYLIQESDF